MCYVNHEKRVYLYVTGFSIITNFECFLELVLGNGFAFISSAFDVDVVAL